MPSFFMTVNNTAWRDVYRPTMRRRLKEEGNRGTEVVMYKTDVPPPGPEYEDLAVADGKGSNWLGTNVYVVGETVEGRTAEFTGGKPPVTYRYRFQTQVEGSDKWTNESWTTTTNAKNPVFFELVEPGKVKFQSQARDANDPIVQLNSTAGTKTVTAPIVYDPLVVGDPVVTGDPLVGSTLSCSEPSIEGGSGDYQCDFFWVDESNAIVWEAGYMGSTTTVVSYDIGKMMKCLVQVTDKGWSGGESVTVSSDSVGPVRAPLIGDLTGSVDGSEYALGDVIDTMNGAEHICLIERTGDPGVTYSWTVRQGQARLSPASGSCIVNIQSDPPQGVQVQCDLINSHASDNPQSFRFAFYVGEGGLAWDMVPNECLEPAVIAATDGVKRGSVLSAVSLGKPSIPSTYYKHYWMACERGRDYEIENNWRSRNSDETYVVTDYDVNHGHVFRLEVRHQSDAAGSDGYSKFAYCYSQVIE